MEQASSAFSTGVPALAAIPQLAGNLRQGFGPVASTMHWASGWVISSNTLGLSTSLYDGDAGSRSTGRERDAESGNDYFGARYYSSALGRFMSPDWTAKVEPVPYAKLDDPQSLNLYAYVRNNPVLGVDADGHTSSGMEAQYAEGNANSADFVGESQNQHEFIQAATDKNGLGELDGGDGGGGGGTSSKTHTTPTASQTCSVAMPTGTALIMVQTLMGEGTGEGQLGMNQYADTESGPIKSVGSPGGAVISNATLDREASLLAGTMLNLGHIGNSRTYRGLSAGKALTTKAIKSPETSAECARLRRDVNAVNNALKDSNKSPYTQWRAVVQGSGKHRFVRELQSGAVRVAGTDFF